MIEVSKSNCFIDSNVWIYALTIDQNYSNNHDIARSLIERTGVVVSTQVINEVCVNLLKKFLFNEDQIKDLVFSFYQRYRVVTFNREVLLEASSLRGQYSFSFWDSLIVASALYAGVNTLYSEDMQDGLVVSERLKIVNPLSNS